MEVPECVVEQSQVVPFSLFVQPTSHLELRVVTGNCVEVDIAGFSVVETGE